MTLIQRSIEPDIIQNLYKNKVIIVYGPRQVGKTTLVKKIMESESQRGVSTAYYTCDELDVKESLEGKTSTQLKSFLGDTKLIIIDEAQRVRNIGLTLKILVDTFPEMQIIATGSSSFDLANEVREPLTGRSYTYTLYPLSYFELSKSMASLELNRNLEKCLQYGMYPEVFMSEGEHEIQRRLQDISENYLYKDILAFEGIKKSDSITRLLQALALQLGNEVSYTELSNLLDLDKNTVEKYIGILEKAFIIFRLGSLSRNMRKELIKKQKIYFYDVGMRNSLIRNYNPMVLRTDAGALWENFCITERKKYLDYTNTYFNRYFWRTYTQNEVDYVEESGGKIVGYEFKYTKDKFKAPSDFMKAYDTKVELINSTNYQNFFGNSRAGD